MKRDIILIIVFITISLLLIGAASANNVGNISNQKIIQSNSIGIISPLNNVNGGTQKTVSNNINEYLIDSGANKFYWGERGGNFSYTWKTYKTTSGSILIIVLYKTKTNSWYGTYILTKTSNNVIKMVYTSPEVKLYSGHPSETHYIHTSLTPVQYYSKAVKSQIRSDGYFSV